MQTSVMPSIATTSNTNTAYYNMLEEQLPKAKQIIIRSCYNDLFLPEMSIDMKSQTDFHHVYTINNCTMQLDTDNKGKKYLLITKAGNRITKVPMTRITSIVI